MGGKGRAGGNGEEVMEEDGKASVKTRREGDAAGIGREG